MNGTVIDIPGINVNVGVVNCNYGPDQAHTIEIKDGQKEVVITICYGKITEVKTK
jgi:hypothetical protein